MYAVDMTASKWWALWTRVHMCSGALIDKEWVLTTYTCANSGYNRQFVVGRSNSNPEEMTLKEKQIFWHEKYNKNTGENNIALVQLAEPVPVTINSTVYGIATLPVRQEVPTGAGMLAGYDSDGKLKTMDLKILNETDCKAQGFNNQTICTEKGKGACSGDDGSPLTQLVGGLDWKLVGLATGVLPCDQTDKVGQYVDVSQFSSWVLDKILQNS